MRVEICESLTTEPTAYSPGTLQLLDGFQSADNGRPRGVKNEVGARLLHGRGLVRAEATVRLWPRDICRRREDFKRMRVAGDLYSVEWEVIVLELKDRKHLSGGVNPSVGFWCRGSRSLTSPLFEVG